MWENLGPKSFQQALIPNELEILCKVLRGNVYPTGVGGVHRPGGLLTEQTGRILYSLDFFRSSNFV